MLLLKQRESQRAVTYFQKELERNPKHVPAMLQIVFQGINAGKFEEGLQDAKQAVEIEPDNFAAYYALGRIYLELNEVSKAVTCFGKGSFVGALFLQRPVCFGAGLYSSQATCRGSACTS